MLFTYILIGVVQGLTEFLPVSSSGHVVLLSKVLKLETDVFLLTIIVHLGTLISVLVVYRKKILEMIKHPFTKYNFMLVLSSVITFIFFLLFGDMVESAFGGKYLAYGFFFSAIVLIISDMAHHKTNNVGWWQAGVIGLGQGLALFPAVSRSGLTICSALLSGVEREKAADYSFLLSIPVILGSSIMEIGKITTISQNTVIPIIFAFIFAIISGILAIKIMLKAIKKAKLHYFALYLIILSITIIAFGLY